MKVTRTETSGNMNIRISTNDITDFDGDVIIVPCDSDLTYRKTGILPRILEKAGNDLMRELTVIGYCEIGYAVIVQGYELKTRHVVFMPVIDHNNEQVRINYVGLHQSLRAAFELASLYKSRSVAVAGIHIPSKRKNFFLSLWDRYFGDNGETKNLSDSEIEDIVISTSKNLESSSIKELLIYKYSK